ncbi:MAG: DUF1697 domain-containing protein [Weeksellaceae bacterium]|nr:DUF1697 domain-containing protein [Weeksellaceae bacterium]
MKKYCAFLRGVNVNGTNMKMAEVCQVFADAGMQNVTSVLASGNIIFSSGKDAAQLKEVLEKAMSQHFGYEAFLFIREEKDVIAMLQNDPFPVAEHCHNYVFIGSQKIEELLSDAFQKAIKADNEKGKTVNSIFYWQIQKGQTLGSEFSKILGKKSLKDQLTSRNINTLEKIIKKFS